MRIYLSSLICSILLVGASVGFAHERRCSAPTNPQHIVNGCYTLDFIASGSLDDVQLGSAVYKEVILRTYINPDAKKQAMYLCPEQDIPAQNLGEMCREIPLDSRKMKSGEPFSEYIDIKLNQAEIRNFANTLPSQLVSTSDQLLHRDNDAKNKANRDKRAAKGKTWTDKVIDTSATRQTLTEKLSKIGSEAYMLVKEKGVKEKRKEYVSMEDIVSRGVRAHENEHAKQLSSLILYAFQQDDFSKSHKKVINDILIKMEGDATAVEIDNFKSMLSALYYTTTDKKGNPRDTKLFTSSEIKLLVRAYTEITGSATIDDAKKEDGSGVTYGEAYNTRGTYKWKDLREALAVEVSNYIVNNPRYANHEFRVNMSDSSQKPKGRAVCTACMVGDTLGSCHQIWCPNTGNACSKYVKQEGDYWYKMEALKKN